MLALLGAALATAANPVYAGAADPVTRSRLDAWRERWLAQWAANVGRSRMLPEGRAVAATWVQGVLMTGARRSGLSPGSRYAVTVGSRWSPPTGRCSLVVVAGGRRVERTTERGA